MGKKVKPNHHHHMNHRLERFWSRVQMVSIIELNVIDAKSNFNIGTWPHFESILHFNLLQSRYLTLALINFVNAGTQKNICSWLR